MLKILIVEDNSIFREALRKDLSEHFPAMRIEEAGNSEEALEKINGSAPHLIFMDIRLPGVNGLQLTKKVKKDFPNTHVAVMTAFDLPEYRQAAHQYGADHFFVKDSFKWDEVVAFVQSIRPDSSAR